VAFNSIYPGWYTGRTVHIHVKVPVKGAVIHLSQLFFDDPFTGTVLPPMCRTSIVPDVMYTTTETASTGRVDQRRC